MRTEQDVDDLVIVWTRSRDPLEPTYSDERPDYLAIVLGVGLFLLCIAVIVVLLYTAVYR